MYAREPGNPVLAGRAITWTDIYQARPVVVITENLAREYWKNPADALGKRVTQSRENPWREIIGVVGNECDDGLNHAATAGVYWPMLIKQWWSEPIDIQRSMAYVVRSARVSSPGEHSFQYSTNVDGGPPSNYYATLETAVALNHHPVAGIITPIGTIDAGIRVGRGRVM